MVNNILETNNCQALLCNENTFIVRVSPDENNLGEILWHSRNAPAVLSFKDADTVKITGYNISIMIPKAFQEEHQSRVRRWINHPSSKRFNCLKEVFIENFMGECYKALVYLKILPVEQGYELFAMLHKLNCDNYIIMDDHFQLATKMPFLSDMKSLGDIDNLNLGLLSPQILEMLEQPSKLQEMKKSKGPFKIDIPLIGSYPKVYAEYMSEIKGRKSISKGERASVLRHFHQKLMAADYENEYELEIELEDFRFGNGSQLIFRYISHNLKSLQDEREVWMRVISKYVETIRESLGVDEPSQDQQIVSMITSQFSESYTHRLAVRLKGKTEARILGTTKKGVIVCLCLLALCSVLRVGVQGLGKGFSQNIFKARLAMESRMEQTGILVNKLFLSGFYKKIKD